MCERVWEHLNGGWIPVFSLVQSARHGTNMAGAIIYAPHLHVRDFCQGCPHTCIRAAWKNGQMLCGCALHLSKCLDPFQMPSPSLKKMAHSFASKNFTEKSNFLSNKMFYIIGKKKRINDIFIYIYIYKKNHLLPYNINILC